MKLFLLALLCAIALAKAPIPLPPDPDIVLEVHCKISTAPDKPGFMPGWYVRVNTEDVQHRKWEALLNVYTPEKLKEATTECADYMAEFRKAQREAHAERKKSE